MASSVETAIILGTSQSDNKAFFVKNPPGILKLFELQQHSPSYHKRSGVLSLAHLGDSNPHRSCRKAQRSGFAAKKKKQGRRSARRCLRRRMTLRPRFDLVPVTGLEPVRSCPQGILSPWCLPFHHTGMAGPMYHADRWKSSKRRAGTPHREDC